VKFCEYSLRVISGFRPHVNEDVVVLGCNLA